MDLGRYKYIQQKKAQEAKKKQKIVEVKEVKLRIKIEEHDYQIKKKHAERFLNDGNKAKITIVGMGGIGCPLAQYLVASGIKNLNL